MTQLNDKLIERIWRKHHKHEMVMLRADADSMRELASEKDKEWQDKKMGIHEQTVYFRQFKEGYEKRIASLQAEVKRLKKELELSKLTMLSHDEVQKALSSQKEKLLDEKLSFAIKKLKESTEFVGNGICSDAVEDMIKELKGELNKLRTPKRTNDVASTDVSKPHDKVKV